MAKARLHVEPELIDQVSAEAVAIDSANGIRVAVGVASTTAEFPREMPPPVPFAERLEKVKAAANPLLEAADVLLSAQAEMPYKLASKEAVATLCMLLKQEMHTFRQLCEQANIRHDHMIGARYCLCTALDEVAMQTEWGRGASSGSEWIRNGLVTSFHQDRKGGDKVYLLIARLLEDPHEHRDLLHVIFHVLSYGFEGRYRHEAGGRDKHEAIRKRLYQEVMAPRGPVPTALSPNAYTNVQVQSKRPSFFELPFWITVTVLSVILLTMFGWYKYQLLSRSAEVEKLIAQIAGKTLPPPVGPAVPEPTGPSLHLKQLLKNEIAAHTVSVDEDESRSAVTFRGDAMFETGGAAVKSSMGPLITKIAKEIAKVPGKVTVLGYTDNIPIRRGRFSSNQALSEERATQVMQMLQAAGVPASRLEAVGKGNSDPIGDNRTAQGRAQNRRVEIIVAR